MFWPAVCLYLFVYLFGAGNWTHACWAWDLPLSYTSVRLQRNDYSDHLPIFKSCCGWFGFLLFNLSSLYILEMVSFSRWWVCKYFLPFCGSSVHSVNCFFCCAEASYVDIIPLVYILLCGLCFWGLIKKIFPYTNVLKSFPRSLLVVP
jgi:hypothetical protein